MKKNYILALDQGTTGSRAIFFDRNCRIVASAYQEFKQYYPKPGWVEHDAEEIWRSCENVIRKALKNSSIDPRQVAAIGITNQRETTLLWDRNTSKPSCRAIVWQCRRTAEICRKLKKHEAIFRRKTGLMLDPYFSGTKIKWLLENVKGLSARAKKGDICFGTIDSWLIWKLTGGQSHVTDATNASRTLIYNIRQFKWDEQLLKILNVPRGILPKVQRSGSLFGHTKAIAGLPAGIPIMAVLGDQQAALYGQGCYEPGTVKNTYGTGCFMVLNTGHQLVYSKAGLLSTIASDEKGKPIYAIEGSIFIAGAVVQWLRDELKIVQSSSQTEDVIKGLAHSSGVYFVPAFTGLGAPYWDSEARGIICGLTRGAGAKQIVRAGLESIAYQTKDVFDLMQKESGRKIKVLKVDGGACKNNFLMQFQSDILGCSILRPKTVELTAQGVAQLAGKQIGFWKTKKELLHLYQKDRVFRPRMTRQLRGSLYDGWKNAVDKARLT